MRSIRFKEQFLEIIDQRLLPSQEKWVRCYSLEDIAQAIEMGAIRGSSTIVLSCLYGLQLEVSCSKHEHWNQYQPCWELAKKRLDLAISNSEIVGDLFKNIGDLICSAPNSSLMSVRNLLDEFVKDFSKGLMESPTAICSNIRTVFDDRELTLLTWAPPTTYSEASTVLLEILKTLHGENRLKNAYLGVHPDIGTENLFTHDLDISGVPYFVMRNSELAKIMRSGEIDYLILDAEYVASNGEVVSPHGSYALAVMARYHQIEVWIIAQNDHVAADGDTGEDVLRGLGPRHLKQVDLLPIDLVTGIITEEDVIETFYEGKWVRTKKKHSNSEKAS